MGNSEFPARIVRCPTCEGDSVYASSNPYRPFCSERCKHIDLGIWADEGFKVDDPGTQSSMDLE